MVSSLTILALDPATKCGWAMTGGISGTWDCSIRRDESAGMRLIRLRSKLRAMLESKPIDLIAFEAARHAAPKMQGALVVQATLQGVILTFCEDHSIEYRGYSPTEIKRHATGKGNAGKPQMIEAAKFRWPYKCFTDDNEVDAAWLLDLAESEYANAGTNGS